MTDGKNTLGGFENLKAGDNAIVTGFLKGKDSYRKKLLAMGITPGTPFKVVRVAPLGDPVEIQVRGYLVSLRREEAALISVSDAA
ncbi:MAG: ferrous iron transport protein A [Alphaproteobacteria bacterium]|nr:ferrous iron transport protein A [Alphaproteobacteria bacterium]MBO4643689.1 ferrous iron transport protein A [Alphaproteobacteria bacterium]